MDIVSDCYDHHVFQLLKCAAASMMNMISSEFAVSIFPRATFEHGVRFRNEGGRSVSVIPRRLMSVLHDDGSLCDPVRSDAVGSREWWSKRDVGDDQCWIIPVSGSSWGNYILSILISL